MAVTIWLYEDEVEIKMESKDYSLIGVIEIATHK